MGRWYAGVVHSHTTRSDGIYSPYELVDKAIKKGLDFIIITDHDQFCDVVPHTDKILVIPGCELTLDNGHTNFWGLRKPIDNFVCDTYEEWNRKVEMAHANGATVCMNHPWCSDCTWLFPKEPEKVDCVEIWNSPQHTDNMICTAWWQDELRKGKKIPAVGGSDFHRNYVVTDFLANPTSYVYAEECTQEAILAAIRAGHVTIAPNVGKTMIELKCGDAIIGDTVKLEKGMKLNVSVSKLKKNHTLKVIDNSGVIFEHKAGNMGHYEVNIPINEPCFVCAQIEYDVNPAYAFVYDKVIASKIPSQKGKPLPPFIYAQTSAIYFE